MTEKEGGRKYWRVGEDTGQSRWVGENGGLSSCQVISNDRYSTRRTLEKWLGWTGDSYQFTNEKKSLAEGFFRLWTFWTKNIILSSQRSYIGLILGWLAKLVSLSRTQDRPFNLAAKVKAPSLDYILFLGLKCAVPFFFHLSFYHLYLFSVILVLSPTNFLSNSSLILLTG